MASQILIPTDGSQRAVEQIEHALDHAADQDATVHALYVVDTQRYSEPALSSVEMVIDDFEDNGREHLERLTAEGMRRGLSVEAHCRRGRPADEIADAAGALDVDLIVPCLSDVTPAQLRHQGVDGDCIVEPRSTMVA